jgi:hypothetical protein
MLHGMEELGHAKTGSGRGAEAKNPPETSKAGLAGSLIGAIGPNVSQPSLCPDCYSLPREVICMSTDIRSTVLCTPYY